MKKVFITILIFYDGGKPKIINTLQDESYLFNRIISFIGKDWYFKFNNS